MRGSRPLPPKLPPDPALARAVRHLREQRKLSQEELASRAGTTFSTINRLETAKSAPAWATVRTVASALDVTLRELADAIEET
jgi:XRE family transcriptional regulator, fatty acid utilization regulator